MPVRFLFVGISACQFFVIRLLCLSGFHSCRVIFVGKKLSAFLPCKEFCVGFSSSAILCREFKVIGLGIPPWERPRPTLAPPPPLSAMQGGALPTFPPNAGSRAMGWGGNPFGASVGLGNAEQPGGGVCWEPLREERRGPLELFGSQPTSSSRSSRRESRRRRDRRREPFCEYFG